MKALIYSHKIITLPFILILSIYGAIAYIVFWILTKALMTYSERQYYDL